LKFKKIVSVFASVLLLGATFSGIVIANNTLKVAENPAIVYGQNAAGTDLIGANNLLMNLNSSTITTINETIVTGESKIVETSSQPLYLGDYMNNTKAIFTKEQLPTILADGKVSDNEGKEYNYNLRIMVPNTVILYGEGPKNLDPPIIYANFNSQAYKYDMRIIFPTAIDPSKLESEEITLFGKKYTFSSNINDLTNNSISLFENSQSIKITDGDSVTIGNNTYSVAVESSQRAIIYVNGESKSVEEGWSGKIKGINVYVKDIFGPNYVSPTQNRFVELYINSNSLLLKNNEEVSISNNNIAGTKSEFIMSGDKISEIKVTVTPYSLDSNIRFLKEGELFIDPVFKSIRFNLHSVSPNLTDDIRDYINVKATREDRVGITFTNKLDKKYELDVLRPSNIMLDANYNMMYNSTCTTESITYPPVYGYNVDENNTIIQPPTYNMSNIIGNTTEINCVTPGTFTYNAPMLGVDLNRNLIVENNKEIRAGDYFITNSGEYSQIWRVENIKSDGKVEIKDAMGGDTTTISIGIGSTGALSLADGSSATLALINSTTLTLQNKASNFVYTYKGAKIILPIDNSGTIQVVEETPYNGGDFRATNGIIIGNTLSLHWSYKNGRAGRDMFLKGTEYGTKDVNYWSGKVGDYDINSMTKYGTFIKQKGSDDKDIEIYYPGNAMKVNFHIGEINSITETIITNPNNIVLVNDVNQASYQNKNIIIVGGSCINTVAARLLGESAPLCGEDFTAKTGVLPGQYLVQTFQNPWAADKIAILVAGYNAEDTTRAIDEVLTKQMNFTVGSKIIA
jgi:hypothetical protein